VTEPVHVIRNLERALADDDFAWSLLLVGEDQTDKLATLTGDLRGPVSGTGDGKQTTSGFSYWGIGPTIAWANATNDPFYLVMKAGAESFLRHWRKIKPHVDRGGFHFVSLGVGTGVKDRTILDDLRRNNRDMYYIPVDMSSEMLRIGTLEPVRGARFPMAQVLPVQLDFSIADNVKELGEMMARLVGDDPIPLHADRQHAGELRERRRGARHHHPGATAAGPDAAGGRHHQPTRPGGGGRRSR
jgi:hypothetical protein